MPISCGFMWFWINIVDGSKGKKTWGYTTRILNWQPKFYFFNQECNKSRHKKKIRNTGTEKNKEQASRHRRTLAVQAWKCPVTPKSQPNTDCIRRTQVVDPDQSITHPIQLAQLAAPRATLARSLASAGHRRHGCCPRATLVAPTPLPRMWRSRSAAALRCDRARPRFRVRAPTILIIKLRRRGAAQDGNQYPPNFDGFLLYYYWKSTGVD